MPNVSDDGLWGQQVCPLSCEYCLGHLEAQRPNDHSSYLNLNFQMFPLARLAYNHLEHSNIGTSVGIVA